MRSLLNQLFLILNPCDLLVSYLVTPGDSIRNMPLMFCGGARGPGEGPTTSYSRRGLLEVAIVGFPAGWEGAEPIE
jgi:hypothetical protein